MYNIVHRGTVTGETGEPMAHKKLGKIVALPCGSLFK